MTEQFITNPLCRTCSGNLIEQYNGVYKCRYCGREWKTEKVIKYNAELEALARRRNDEVRKTYVSNMELKRICNKILDLNPDDFYSRFYLATCIENNELDEIVATMDIETYYDNIDKLVEYLIRGLQDRWINATSTLIEKAYKSNDVEKYDRYRTRFEEMADKVNDGMFNPLIPRDVFIAYSSQDMKKVNELLRILEDKNGLSCFVAARNLRHGSGAVENYWDAIQKAMRHCKTVVFVSSVSSRKSGCDVIKELDYISQNLPKMRRIEFLVENYRGIEAERFFKEFFDGLEYCTSVKEVATRYFDQGAQEVEKRKTRAGKPDDKKREKELKAIEAKRRAQRFAEATAEFFTKLLRFLLVLAIIGGSIALIGAFIYFYPQLGIWAMIFIGVAVGAIFVIIGTIALKRSSSRRRTGKKIIGLYILAIAIAVWLIFVSRETAYMALPFIIIVSIFLFFPVAAQGHEGAFVLLIAAGILSIFSVNWTTSWGMSSVSFDGATVTYNLNRSEDVVTAEYYDNKNILGGINAPNADTVIIENGYKTLLNGSLSICDGMFALYIPSSVTEIQEKAIAKCENLKAVYIGYNADGTPSSDTSSLRKIGFDAFANSPINVIYYNGSISEWESITKDGQDVLFLGKTEWNKNMGSFEVICNDGTLEYN